MVYNYWVYDELRYPLLTNGFTPHNNVGTKGKRNHDENVLVHHRIDNYFGFAPLHLSCQMATDKKIRTAEARQIDLIERCTWNFRENSWITIKLRLTLMPRYK